MRQTRSLSTVLYLLFLPLLVGSVGTTTWLAHRAGQQSVDEVASALGHAYDQRIRQRVRTYLAEPRLVTSVNRTEMELGLLDPHDMVFLRRRFAQQLIDFGGVAFIYYGTEDGDVIGFQRETDGAYSFSLLDDAGRFVTHEATADFGIGPLIQQGEIFDPRKRPWYTAAVEAKDTTWTDIYVWFGRDELCIDVVAPIFDDAGALIGVVDAGYTLGLLSRFLEGMQIGKTGEAYIVDKDGLLVATSTGQALLRRAGDQATRLRPGELDAPLSAFVARALATDAAESRTRTPEHPELGPITVMVGPVGVDDRLDWTLVVAIPQSDFTAHYAELTWQTVYLSIAAVLMTVLAVLVFVRRLAGPLRQLVYAAKRVQVGELDVELPEATRDEIGQLTVAMGEMLKGLRERETIRDAFGRYVTRDVAEQVLADPDAMRLGGVRRRVTILMSDLRGFTAQSNQLEPEALVNLLNEYLGEMTRSIVDAEGLIVEFIGDAILVLFGATGAREDDALRACRCALDMHDRLDALNAELAARGEPRLQMGIGVHTGEVVVGNIGSEHRIKFGVVGDAVNTTARVESLTVGGQTLVSASTRAAMGDALAVGDPVSSRVKGLTAPLVVHELIRAGAAPVIDLPPIAAGEEAALYRLVNKVLTAEPIPVRLTVDPDGRLRAESDDALSPHEDIMIALTADASRPAQQLYCKVTAVDGAGPFHSMLVPTALAPGSASEA